MADDDALTDAELDALFARAKAGKMDMNGITRRVLAKLAQMRQDRAILAGLMVNEPEHFTQDYTPPGVCILHLTVTHDTLMAFLRTYDPDRYGKTKKDAP